MDPGCRPSGGGALAGCCRTMALLPVFAEVTMQALHKLALLALLLLSASSPAAAGELEIGVGRALEIDGETTGVATAAWLTSQRHPWEFLVGYLGERGDGARTVEDNAWVAVSRRLTWRRFYLSLGAALAVEDNEVLSDHFQFQTGGGYRFGDVSVSVRHLSNAGISGRNRGETFLLLHYAF